MRPAATLAGLCLVVGLALAWPQASQAQVLSWGQDVGAVGAAGASSYDAPSQTYALTGAGAGIGGTADAFHFAYYQAVCGDGSLVVRLGRADASAQAAVVLRASLDGGSPSAAATVGGGTAQFVRRTAAGGVSAASGALAVGAPCWLKIVRQGDQVSAYASPDRQTWTALGSDTVALGASTFYVGLAVSNGVAGGSAGTAAASFDGLLGTFLPGGDLALWLKADAGVSQDASGRVRAWADQSGGSHDVFQANAGQQPSLAAAALNGWPALHFDGEGKCLQVPDVMGGAGAGELFVVLRATDPARRHSFLNFTTNYVGLSIYPATDGHLYESFGSTTFYDLGLPLTDVTQFHLYNATSAPGQWSARLNGQPQFTAAGNAVGFPSAPSIGYSDNYAGTYFAGDIAEVLVYRRALSPAERAAVEAYLNGKYSYTAPPAAPAGLSVTPLSATQVLLAWTEASSNVSGYTVERQNMDGTWSLAATLGAGAASYLDGGLTPGAAYSYRVSAANAAGSSPASAAATGATSAPSGGALPTSGLQLWLRADAGVSADASGGVAAWADLTGGAAAIQGNPACRPALVGGDLNGLPALRFDGASSYLDTKYLSPAGPEVTLFVVAKGANYQSLLRFQPPGSGSYLVYPWYVGQAFIDSNDGGCYAGLACGLVPGQWNIGAATYQSGGSMATYRNGSLVASRAAGAASLPGGMPLDIGRYSGGSEYTQADVAEILIYNRALGDAERQAVEAYLNGRYAVVAPPGAPANLSIAALSATQVALSWSETASNVSGYAVERQNPDGSWSSLAAMTGKATTYIDGSLAPGMAYAYRVTALSPQGNSPASSSAAGTTQPGDGVGAAFPLNELRLWLKADAGVSQDASGRVRAWADQSGGSHDVFQANAGQQPSLAAAALNGWPALHFDGEGKCLQVPDVMSGAGAGELFVVLRATDPARRHSFLNFTTNYVGLSIYPATDGHLYESFGSTTFYDLGLPLTDVTQFHLYNATSAPGQWSARLNGQPQFTAAGNAVGFPSAPSIGYSDNYAGTYFAGDIAEVLVFDHALSARERQTVESYLNGRYAVVAPPGVPAAPSVSAVSATQADLFWTAAPGAEGYLVERQDATTGSGFVQIAAIAGGQVGSFIDEGLTPGASYVYRVRASNAAGESAYSPEAALTLANAGGLPASLPAVGDLRLWLRPEAGVAMDASGRVSAWADASGHGNDAQALLPGGQPLWVAGALNGQPALRFDGQANSLATALPVLASGQDATVLAVVGLPDASRHGSFVKNGLRAGFALGVGSGTLDGTGNDALGIFDYVRWLSPGSSWGVGGVLAELCLDPAGNPSMYRNGKLLGSLGGGGPAPSTGPTFIGGYHYDTARYFGGDIAEVLMFDRRLTDAERQAWEQYLNAKYQFSPPPPAPTQLAATALSATQASLAWVDSFADVAGYRVERRNPDGTWSLVAALGPGNSSYVVSGLAAGTPYTFRVTAYNGTGDSPVAIVALTTPAGGTALPVGDLRLWLRADSGTITDAGGNLSQWLDRSGHGSSAAQTSSGSQPTVAAGALNGLPAVHFSGNSAYLRLPDALLGGAVAAEAFAVVRAAAPLAGSYRGLWKLSGRGGYQSGSFYPADDGSLYESFGAAGRYGPLLSPAPLDQFNLYDVAAAPGAWMARLNGLVMFSSPSNAPDFSPGNLLLGAGAEGAPFTGDLAEVLVFDHALSASERLAVQTYLASKYALAPALPAPANLSAHALSPGRVALAWSLPASTAAVRLQVEREIEGSNAYQVIATLDDAASYIDATAAGNTAYRYRVAAVNLAGGTSAYSNEASALTPANGTDLPLNGLRLWLKAGTGTAGSVTYWPDQSGNGNDASQISGVHPPQAAVVTVASGVDRPVVRFDGASYLRLPDTLLGGAIAAEAFAVVRAAAPLAGSYRGLWKLSGRGSGSFYPAGDGNPYESFGASARYGPLLSPAPLDQYNLYNVTAASGAWTARMNWKVLLNGTANTPDFSPGNLLLGAGSEGTPFTGDLAEVVIFDHALNDDERLAVEQYFTSKYALVPALVTPSNLSADASAPTQVSLAWQYAGGDGNTQFIIERAIAGTNSYQKIAVVGNVRSFLDTTAAANTAYSYRIVATDAAGDISVGSNAVRASTPLSGPAAGPWCKDLVTTFTNDGQGHVASQIVDKDGLYLETKYTYDANGNRKSVTAPNAAAPQYAFDANGNPVAAAKHQTYTTTFQYDALNHLTEVDYPIADGQSSQNKTIGYDASGNKASETDENGHATTYEYDGLNRLALSTHPMDAGPAIVVQYGYNAVNSRISVTDPTFANQLAVAHTTRFDYDALQRLTLKTDARGDRTTYDYSGKNSGGNVFDSSSFKPTTVTDPRGHIEETAYDELYRPTTITRHSEILSPDWPKGFPPEPPSATFFTYDNVGNVRFSTDPDGNTTETIYDALNRAVRVNYADGTCTRTVYTNTGLKWQTYDELQQPTEMHYDGAGRLTETYGPPPDPDNAPTVRPLTQTSYDANGNVQAKIDPRGQEWDYGFDQRNRKTDEFQPAVADYDSGAAVRPHLQWQYDAVGNVKAATDARQNHTAAPQSTATLYDWANRPYQVTSPSVPVVQPDGTTAWTQPVVSTAYDANGNALSVTDPNTHSTVNTYDELNRLSTTTRQTDAGPDVVTYGYDAVGNRTSVQDGNLNTTTLGYDGLNRNVTVKDALGLVTAFAYDGLNKVKRLDANGQLTLYDKYDRRNRLKHVHYPDSPLEDRSYGYDDAGRLLAVADGHGAATAAAYTYDGLGRVQTETSSQATHTYGYDLNGNRLSAQYGLIGGGGGRLLTSSYDALNRLDTLAEGSNTTKYHYDLDGYVRAKDLPSGEKEVTGYDALGRQTDSADTQSGGGLLYSYSYGHDAGGNLRLMAAYQPGLAAAARTTVLGYDAADRLTREAVYSGAVAANTAASPAADTGYGYDPAGNRTRKGVAGGPTTAYTPNALNQLTGFTEDTTGRSVGFTYDANGNRKTRTEGAATDTYAYDPENRLAGLDKGGASYAYLYDYRTRRVGRTEAGAATQVVFSGATSVAEYAGSGGNGGAAAIAPSVEFVRGSDWGGGVGGILYSLRGGSASFDHYDARGDVAGQTSAGGTLTWQAQYEAWGTRVQEFGADPDRQRASTKEEDPTGLLNEGMRYRDLETGGFTTRDPAGFVDGPNLYAYVNANPWTKFDPEGLWSWEDTGNAFKYSGQEAYGMADSLSRLVLEQSYRTKVGDAIFIQGGHDYEMDGVRGVVNRYNPVATLLSGVGGIDQVNGSEIDEVERGRRVVNGLFGTIDAGLGGLQIVKKGISLAQNATEAVRPTATALTTSAEATAEVETEVKSSSNCFVTGTLIETKAGPMPIEQVVLGSRVLTSIVGQPQDNSTELLQDTCRSVTLTMPNPDGSPDALDIVLLRSEQWCNDASCKVGRWIWFKLTDMEIVGWAQVVGLERGPQLAQGAGRLVTATVTHHNSYVYRLTLADEVTGLLAVLEPTNTHRLYSEDRDAWVATAELHEGERLRGEHGTIVVVRVEKEKGWQRVYNLEVEGDHRYFAGALQALSHNNCNAPSTRRVQTGGDITLESESAARREAMRRHGAEVSKENNFTREDVRDQPNSLGPKGEPSEKLKTMHRDGREIEIQHHKWGHNFKDNNTHELPHYQGPNGEHISYEH